jgi:hypothetical protein
MKEATVVWGVPRPYKSDIHLNIEDSAFRHLAFLAFIIHHLAFIIHHSSFGIHGIDGIRHSWHSSFVAFGI